MNKIAVGGDTGNCLGCPELFGAGLQGMWFKCAQTKDILGNLSVKPKNCPYLGRKKDVGDDLLDVTTRAIMQAIDQLEKEDVDD